MSMRNLVEGDCGGPSPLIRLASHYTNDHGLKEEGVRDLYGSLGPYEVEEPETLVKHFLEETHPNTFKMDDLMQEMRDIDQNIHAPVTAPGVVEELTSQDTAWANQYLQSGGHFQETHSDDIWNVHPHRDTKVAFQGETDEQGLGPIWAAEYLEQRFDFNGKESNHAYSKFLKFMRQEGDLPSEPEPTTLVQESLDDYASRLAALEKATYENAEEPTLSGVDEQCAASGSWLDPFKEAMKPLERITTEPRVDKATFWKILDEEWNRERTGSFFPAPSPWFTEEQEFYDPFKQYNFSEVNPMSNLTNALEEGKRSLEKGDLPGAVLCFEAAVKEDPENAEAWLLLGKTQAENEQDPLAIPALKECIRLDPSNLSALMALAVSYTNESYQRQACATLKRWLLKNEKYQHLTPSAETQKLPERVGVSTVLFGTVYEEVKDLLIQAARMQPSGIIDADVQCALGVLFNLAGEYEKAADCLKAAVQVRPEDPKLWNRLGAILANGQRSEEAIDAYHQALLLSPGFIRARYNLGISCINLNAYKAAVEHLLTALNQQAAAQGAYGEKMPTRVMSDTIWSTLRLAVSLMRKNNLTDAVENRDLDRLNKEFDMGMAK